MIHSIFPQYDTFIDEYNETQNNGTDAIIEVGKTIINDTNYAKRVLVKYDLTEINNLIDSGIIGANPRYYFNLKISEIEEANSNYTIEILSISGSEMWKNGLGKSDDYPKTVEGVSWLYKTGNAEGDSWIPETPPTFSVATTGSYNQVKGGGTWWAGSVATQSFEFEQGDIRIDVTDQVNAFTSHSNQGFIVKFIDSEEKDTIEYGSLKFFSVDSHTIYVPRLEVLWDDFIYTTSSAISTISEESIANYTTYIKNLKDTYRRGEKAKIRFYSRNKYPIRTYSTSSAYLSSYYYLPKDTCYEIRDAYTNEAIIPFDTTYTKVSADSISSYIEFWTQPLFPERRYKIVLKSVWETENITDYLDNNYIFKVVK